MDTVEVVKDKFRPKEEFMKCLYYTFIGIFVTLAFATDVLAFFYDDKHHWNPRRLNYLYQIITSSAMMIYLLLTTIMFGCAGKWFQNAEFHDHKCRYFVQFTGMFTAIACNIGISCFLFKQASDSTKDDDVRMQLLIQILIRNISGFIFVLSKTPKDCFLCFSKLKNIKYSIWQYKEYTYTE